ncbi:MAG: carbohydrate ABC transporter permease, partial [Opitutaceae bacterium]|nr:carbohydrate ABC transporter permease [Opitutaceae bacterium]
MIISTLDRRTPQGRAMMLAIYGVLFAGAVSMLYPFLLMVRLTTADNIDSASLSVVPEYFWDEDILARKYLAKQYQLIPGPLVGATYGSDWTSLTQAPGLWENDLAPFASMPRAQITARVADLRAFALQADPRLLGPLHTFTPGRTFENFWISYWLARRDPSLVATQIQFEPFRPDFRRRDWLPSFDASWTQWQEWQAQLPAADRFVYSAHVAWRSYLAKRYDNNLSRLNAAHAAAYPAFTDGPRFLTTPPAADAPPALAADWTDFVTTRYPLLWQELRHETVDTRTPEWQAWLASKLGITDSAAWTRLTQLPSSEGYDRLPVRMPTHELTARWWFDFVAARCAATDRILLSGEAEFAAFLEKRHGTVAALNTSWGTSFGQWTDAPLPQKEADYLTLVTHSGSIKWMLSTANFRSVIKSLLIEGRSFTNTGIIVLLSVLTALTINPLAAYALSRFRVRGTNKVLIFLLATMALPAEVAMVPNFLLVRDLHLIDTYWALVLPSAANAFSIFLLKGFFDSLPQELYEAALIDGAGEFTLFTRITIPLSMPILAVTLLGTVTHAYNLFMPAVMYLGDTKLWPVATKIYQI